MSSLLSSAQLAAMQAAQNLTLDFKASASNGCQVLRRTVAPGAQGGPTGTFANHGSQVDAAMAEPSDNTRATYAAQLGTRQSWMISLPFGTDVLVGDRVMVNGLTLDVVADLSKGSYSTLTQVLAAKVS
jgi:hypothetical protein